MCFYDQYQFECGDFKFGHFRRRCSRVCPRGRSCGLKTAYEVFQLQKKCSLCGKIATNRHGQQQEWDRIECLESKEQADEKGVQRSIDIINQLQQGILKLEMERRGRQITTPGDDLENTGSASLGPTAESTDLVATSTASIVTKSSPSPPSDKPEDKIEGDPSLPRASPSATRASDALQLAEWKACPLSLLRESNSKENCIRRSTLARSQSSSAIDSWMSAGPPKIQLPSNITATTQASRTFPRFQLQVLIMRYHFLDTISLMKPDVIKSRMDSICAKAPTGSMMDDLVSVHTRTPRPWLAIRRMSQDLGTSVLHTILSMLSDALTCTSNISHAKPSELALTAGERKLLEGPFYDCIYARKLVIVFLRDNFRAFIDGSTFPNAQPVLITKPQELNIITVKGVECIERKAISAEKRSSTGPLAARLVGAFTFFSLDTFGELVRMIAYRTR